MPPGPLHISPYLLLQSETNSALVPLCKRLCAEQFGLSEGKSPCKMYGNGLHG
jgi:hypothetical protein